MSSNCCTWMLVLDATYQRESVERWVIEQLARKYSELTGGMMFSCVTCAVEGKNECAEEEVITRNDVTRTRYYLCKKHRLELQDFILKRGKYGKPYLTMCSGGRSYGKTRLAKEMDDVERQTTS